METKIGKPQDLLKKALEGNALFSSVSGLLVVVLNRWLVEFMGLPQKVSLIALGVSLLVYGGLLWSNARRERIGLGVAWLAVILDGMWLVGSCALVLGHTLSLGGNWLVALVGEGVLAFAVLQWVGIRRIKKHQVELP